MYTIVPRHVREDMEWMSANGADAIVVALLEQDLTASLRNMELITREADRKGMKILAVPSRWAGLCAGAPKVPSYFTITHPETWITRPDGSCEDHSVTGRISSIFHPATYDFMCEAMEKMLRTFEIAGIVWDEVKVFDRRDDSRMARAVLGDGYPMESFTRAAVDFFGRLNGFAKSVQPSVFTSLFLYSHLPKELWAPFAAMPFLDEFGCDGRPWHSDDQHGEHERKTILGPESGERFFPVAKREGKRVVALLETHAMSNEAAELMPRYYDAIARLPIDHHITYYYGRDCEDPDFVMDMTAGLCRAIKGQRPQ